MKLLFIIFFILFSFISRAQVLTDSMIRANNISQVTAHTKGINKNGLKDWYETTKTVTSYNRHGSPVKSTRVRYVTNKVTDSAVTSYFYKDTLLVKTDWKEYLDRKLADHIVETYSYTFDSLSRKTSWTTYTGERVSKEEYTRDNAGNIKETRYYSNDSAVYIPERRGYDFLVGKELRLNRTIVNYHDAENVLLKTIDCKTVCKLKYINESYCCTTTEYSRHRDTTIQKISFYNEGWQTVFEKEYRPPYGASSRESRRGDRSLIVEQKNKKGLATRVSNYEIRIEGYVYESITSYEYKFHPANDRQLPKTAATAQ